MTTNAKTPISRAPRKPGTKPIPIRLTQDEIKEADKYCAVEDRKRSDFIRVIYLSGLKEYKRRKGFC